jgi:hypothetical protein
MIQSKSDERVPLLRVDWINEDCAAQGYQRALVTCPSQFSLLHAMHPDQSLTAILIKFLRALARFLLGLRLLISVAYQQLVNLERYGAATMLLRGLKGRSRF